mgnify:CR=1 FL=1
MSTTFAALFTTPDMARLLCEHLGRKSGTLATMSKGLAASINPHSDVWDDRIKFENGCLYYSYNRELFTAIFTPTVVYEVSQLCNKRKRRTALVRQNGSRSKGTRKQVRVGRGGHEYIPADWLLNGEDDLVYDPPIYAKDRVNIPVELSGLCKVRKI